jgi:hypothetical protein
MPHPRSRPPLRRREWVPANYFSYQAERAAYAGQLAPVDVGNDLHAIPPDPLFDDLVVSMHLHDGSI